MATSPASRPLPVIPTSGLRVSAEEEITGLDILEHGSPGYGERFGSFRATDLTDIGSVQRHDAAEPVLH